MNYRDEDLLAREQNVEDKLGLRGETKSWTEFCLRAVSLVHGHTINDVAETLNIFLHEMHLFAK